VPLPLPPSWRGSGLVLAASAAIAHDIYVNVIKDGHADQKEQVFAARVTSFVVGAVGIVIGIAAEKQNVAHLVALAFAVASSGNLPVVVMSLFWKKFNTAGVIAGLVVGTVASIGLVMISPNMTYPEVVANNAKLAYSKLEKEIADGKVKPEAMEKTLKTIEAKKAEEAKNRGGKSMLGLSKPLFTQEPRYPLYPAGLHRCHPGNLDVPLQKGRGDVGRDLCAPEHRHRHGQGHRPLSRHLCIPLNCGIVGEASASPFF